MTGDQELRPRVAEPVLELGPRPPRVEGHDDRAGSSRRPERDRPVGEVAHRDRDTVALAHTEVVDESVSERGDRGEVLSEGERLVFVHEEGEVAVGEALLEHRAERGRGELPRAGGDPPDLHLFHLEHLAW